MIWATKKEDGIWATVAAEDGAITIGANGPLTPHQARRLAMFLNAAAREADIQAGTWKK